MFHRNDSEVMRQVTDVDKFKVTNLDEDPLETGMWQVVVVCGTISSRHVHVVVIVYCNFARVSSCRLIVCM